MASANEGSQKPLSWVWSCDSTVNACAERSLFKEYTEFTTHAYTELPNGLRSVQVAGIGTIELPVMKEPHVSGPVSHGTLSLTKVLHIPELPFNVIGETSDISFWVQDDVRERVGFLYNREKSRITRLEITGHNYGVMLYNTATGSMMKTETKKPLKEYPVPVIFWRKGVRDRWDSHLAKEFRSVRGNTSDVVQNMKKLLDMLDSDSDMKKEIAKPSSGDLGLSMDDFPYIPAEKAWLEALFGSERQFLQIHGLNPCETDHRREGRKMARVMILDRLSSDKDDEEMYHNQGSGWRPDYSHPNCKFSAEEVKLIDERWGNAVNFMRALRLNVCNGQDWKIAKGVLGSFQSRDPPV
ncbi:hypothetical protein F5Y03DRAFT_408655 [Xylaria venustula]|nr:hypothetical protein F5Y03DRAFT_408655 [Xylaria venustula]